MALEIVALTPREIEPAVFEARGPDGSALWRAEVRFGDERLSPFREGVLWQDAGLVAVGGEDVVVLLDAATGAERKRISVPSFFGHLSIEPVDGREWLFILGWCDVHARAPDLTERWVSRGIAVDGITGGTVEGEVLLVHAEMDPPGGGFAVELDVRTGRELKRTLAFTEDYVGLYGAGKPTKE